METGNGKIVATPECHSLWVVAPSILLNYEGMIIDQKDYKELLNPDKGTKLETKKASRLQELKDKGFVEVIDYGDYLNQSVREYVHNSAEEFVDGLLQDSQKHGKFLKLSLQAHETFANFLGNYLEVSEQEKTLEEYLTRLDKVEKREKALSEVSRLEQLDEKLIDELAFTLKRETAKALAGLVVCERSDYEHLYDLPEYKPIIEDYLLENYSGLVSSDFTSSNTAYDAIIGALAKRKIPEVSFSDRKRVIDIARDREEFGKLREIVKDIENRFAAFFEVEGSDRSAEKVRAQLVERIEELERKYREEIRRKKQKFEDSLTFVSLEMAVSQFLAFLSPLLERGKEKIAKNIEEDVRKSFLGNKDLSSHLFYLFELWKSSNRQELLKSTDAKIKAGKYSVWGEEKDFVPWYESS